MARKVEALQEIITTFEDITLSPDMSAADCIHEIANQLEAFLDGVRLTITSFDARIKALEGNG